MNHRQALIFDGDDTLWENNVFFERAIESFIDHLAHSTASRVEVRKALNAFESANSRTHGYGAIIFAESLVQCYESLCERDVTPEDLDQIRKLALTVKDEPIMLLPGVAEAVSALATRHTLFLLTKGDQEEQQQKVAASGLEPYFHKVIIVAEKQVDTYRSLAAAEGLDPNRTWMIGNSPRSDVAPALEAGLNAVLVPHPVTWCLEDEPLPALSSRFFIVEGLASLLRHF